MTEKELLYLEDAVGHEKNIISICDESINMLEESNLVSFFEDEKEIHNGILSRLMNLLEGKVDE